MQQLYNLIENTHRSVFLTGKAGTGKTTFLTNFVQRTKKKFVVVAPTGIAAVNAGGVTIHSMFGLPLKTFIPSWDNVDPNEANNLRHLLPHFRFRGHKLKLLRCLELLIVDEVSMLRCDVMDMMDMALRAARRSSLPFGGVQLLLIGDLYQLPPVVKEDTEKILFKYYPSPFFFDAVALKEFALLTVELKTVFRQTDAVFLQLLNAIRNRDFEAIDFDRLHSRYQPDFEPEEFWVYLTTHNYMADHINRRNLNKLTSETVSYTARISGDFKPNLYPNEETMQLKEGAQVMFIRNDASESKKFFNGMLARVTELWDDYIKVLPHDQDYELTIERESWENKRYSLGADDKIKEEIIGTYEQFPFRLAWAVTIHKSQGLTFDRVIIDAGRSFTAGQVYVALSRCRTLEGIVLKSKVTPDVIITDDRISFFQTRTSAGEKIEAILQDEKYNYATEKLLQKLDTYWLQKELERWKEAAAESRFLKDEEANMLATQLLAAQKNLAEVHRKFMLFANAKTKRTTRDEINWQQLETKSIGAVMFFFEHVKNSFFDPIKNLYTKTKGAKGLKGYNEILKTLIEDMETYLNGLKTVSLLGKPLFTEKDTAPVSAKVEKKPSHLITFQMFEQGLEPAQIAAARKITAGTVLNHLAKIATAGVLDIERLFSAEAIGVFEKIYAANRFKSIGEWKAALPNTFDFNEIRVLLHHFNYQRSKQEKPN